MASRIPCFCRCGAWFHRTRLRSKRALEGRERHMARGVKSNFRASRIVLVKYTSSVCALTEDIHKHVNLDQRHPLLASIQCHSNTTIFLAMLNPALTIQIHSNTTISLNSLAPTLPARLLQYPNVNSLPSSPGRDNFPSRSQHARLLTISECDALVTSIVGMGDAEKLHRQVFKRRCGLPRSRCREAPATFSRRG